MTTGPLRTPTLAPGCKPLLGHGLAMKRRAGDFLTSLQNRDPITMIKLGREPVYVVNDPALIRDVLRDDETYARGGPVTERFRMMFGNGLGISEGAFHRRQRAVIQPAFDHQRIVGYTALMSRATTNLIDSWEDGACLQVNESMDDLALANVTALMFAADTVLDRPRFMACTAVVLGGLLRRITDPTGLLTRLPTPANRRYREAATYIHDTIDAVIREYRVRGGDQGDLLSLMLFASDEHGRPLMSDQELHDEVMTFFIAGSNTISNTLSWACYEVAVHPEVERRLNDEVDEVLCARGVRFTDLARLDYTRRVVTETLRMRTQGLFLSRRTTRSAALGGYAIPSDATVLYSFHALNHNPLIHPEPERFDPDRWLPERMDSLAREAFMPFGLGVHRCIGDQFSWTEMTVTLATISSQWRLVPASSRPPQPKPALTMPVDALPMTVHRRQVQPARVGQRSAGGDGGSRDS